MRIYTLGTGHGDSTFSRFNSSTAYEAADGTLYLVDAGEPVEALIRRKGLEAKNIRAVFITHMHGDHAGGLMCLIKQIIKYSPRHGRDFPMTVHFPEAAAIEPLKGWIRAVHEDPDSEYLEYKSFEDGLVYEDDNISVTAHRTAHLRTRGRTDGDPCSFSFVLHFKKEDRTILHTGDLRGDFSDFPKVASEMHFDACICEATHYQPETAMPKLMASKFDRLIFSHIADRWHIHIYKAWEVENGEKALLKCCEALPYPVVVAHDGDEFLI